MIQLLNLGCGTDFQDNAMNLDISKHHANVDVVWDLNDLHWPFDDNSVQRILAKDVFEHLRLNLVEVMNECHRILASNGTIYIKYPLAQSPRIADDPTHRWHWSAEVLTYFDPVTKYGRQYTFYTPYKWTIVSRHQHKDLSMHAELRVIK